MSSPASLYFRTASPGTPPVLVAESYSYWNELPGLWRLLLAEADRYDGPACRYDGAVAIVCAAASAVERLQRFIGVVGSHPLLHRIPELPVYLAAVESYLRQQIAAFPKHERRLLLLIAEQPPDRELTQPVLEDFAALEHALHGIVASGSYWELDDALRLASDRLEFTQWRPWVQRFGLDTLSHPYFKRLEIDIYDVSDLDPPAAIPFEDFARKRSRSPWAALRSTLGSVLRQSQPGGDATDQECEAMEDDGDAGFHEDGTDDDIDSPWAGSGFRPVRCGTKMGLRFVPDEAVFVHLGMDQDEYVDPDPDKLALAAEWDDILAGSNLHAWVRRGDKWGLIDLRRECRLLVDPCVDAVVQADQTSNAHVVSNGLCGLICMKTGQWLAAPTYDEMVWNPDRHWPVWRVRRGQRWGLLSTKGELFHDCVFDTMPAYQGDMYLHATWGMPVRRDGRAGWVSHGGALEIPCEWDEVNPVDTTGLFLVKRDGAWGLAVRGGDLWLPCIYQEVEPLVIGAHLQEQDAELSPIGEYTWPDGVLVDAVVAAADPVQINLLVAVRTASGAGVVDQANRTVVPARYAEVAAVENGDYRDARWVYLTGMDGKKGLWSIAAAAEVFACRHSRLDLYAAPRIPQPLVGIPDGEHYRLWNVDGTPAYAEPFLSISACWCEGDRVFVNGVNDWERARIAGRWCEDQPVRARLADQHGTMMFLLPGKPLVSLEDTLAGEYRESGDKEAALALAEEHLRNGNEEAARLWAARACGHESSPVAVPRTQQQDIHAQRAEHSRFAKRVLFFATLLDQGTGGPRDAALALHWMRRAAKDFLSEYASAPAFRLLLGKLLLDPAAGPIDKPAAVETLAGIRHPDLEEGMASLLLARCALDDPDPEPELAHAWLVRADAGGVDEAAPELAALLDRIAVSASRSDAFLLRREAAYYRAKAAAR